MKNFGSETIDKAITSAPRFIQDAIEEGVVAQVSVDLGKKYQLHVDRIGEFAENVRNMVVGLLTPLQFMDELAAMGIAPQISRDLVKDLNDELLIPLREKEKSAPLSIAKPAPLPLPALTVPPSVPTTPATLQTMPIRTAVFLPGSEEPIPQAANAPAVIPESRPGTPVMPSAPEIRPTAPSIPPTETSIPQSAPMSPRPITKTYAADPYREPME